ncbi:hypothetical protein FN846DRAFT_888187 [Sphaerosporella brunnea]|uniref:Uncharacterized protein n=1 Tax=Sphaerosporella brunnea TaxID=1250544 RepID=A0A5J5F3N5_9PEZI|nr:hypothetical protein FN846DRAFT_888187 [Sphaerosporella brunnea]
MANGQHHNHQPGRHMPHGILIPYFSYIISSITIDEGKIRRKKLIPERLVDRWRASRASEDAVRESSFAPIGVHCPPPARSLALTRGDDLSAPLWGRERTSTWGGVITLITRPPIPAFICVSPAARAEG